MAYKTILNNLPLNGPTSNYYVKHPDSRFSNFLVNPETYNITAIIDWELITTLPAFSAFQSPHCFVNNADMCANRILAPGIDESRFLKIVAEKEEVGEEMGLAGFAKGKLGLRLEECAVVDPWSKDFMGLFRGWWELALGRGGGRSFQVWREEALRKYGDGGF
jgi:hypothetical protein